MSAPEWHGDAGDVVDSLTFRRTLIGCDGSSWTIMVDRSPGVDFGHMLDGMYRTDLAITSHRDPAQYTEGWCL